MGDEVRKQMYIELLAFIVRHAARAGRNGLDPILKELSEHKDRGHSKLKEGLPVFRDSVRELMRITSC